MFKGSADISKNNEIEGAKERGVVEPCPGGSGQRGDVRRSNCHSSKT